MIVIQSIETGLFLKHNGDYDSYYPYKDVANQEEAEDFSSLDHAQYAATWYADMNDKWRVIDTVNGNSYVKNEHGNWQIEAKAA